MFIPTLAPKNDGPVPGSVGRQNHPDGIHKITWASVKKRPRLRVAGAQVKECG